MKIRINISLFLISFSVFLYQVCLLRLLSIADFYHFAFLIVSVALLGFGISGSFLYFFINRVKEPRLIYLIFSLGYSFSVIISFLVINLIPFDSFKIAWELKQLFYLFIYYIFLIAPFFFGGSFIGYVFFDEQRPSITYFFNLIGSAAGAIAFLFLLPLIDKTGVIILSSLLGTVSVFLLLSKKYAKIFLSVTVVFLVLVSLLRIFLPGIWDIKISPYKSLAVALRYPSSELIYSEEDSSSRLDIIESENIKSAAGISLKYQGIPPPQMGLTVDADNLSPITSYSENGLGFLDFMPQSLFYIKGKEYEDILVIEPGGGLDLLAAEYFTDADVYAVQDNTLLKEALEEKFSEYSGGIYNRVSVIDASIRNYSNTTENSFDLIVMCLNESFHPISSGAYSLNENYIYTKDCFSDLIDIAKGSGIIAITRWLQFPPSENLKILSTLLESLEENDIKNIPDKIFAYRSWSTFTTLFKKDGFIKEEIEKLRDKAAELNYDVVYYDGISQEEVNRFNKLDKPYYYEYYKNIIEASQQERIAFYSDYYFNIGPVTDDKPYFYNFFKFRQVPDILKYFGKSTQPFGGGGYLILIAAILISIILSLFLILLPLRIKKISLSLKGNYPYIFYFLAIGLGFFFIELPFIQKFILILGKPSYSLSLILFSILLFAGIGSFITNRFKVNLYWIVVSLVLYVALFLIGFRYLSDFLLSRQLWQRFIYTVLLIMPAGFLMGIPFPLGLSIVKAQRPEIIPWLWAINGCASVVGSISAVIISLHLGYLVVIGLSALLYLASMLSFKFFRHPLDISSDK